MTVTVLVTGAGGGVGQGVIKALRMMPGEPVRIVAADMSPWAAGLYAADVACLVPMASAPDYVDAIIALCRRERVDYYLPGTDVELVACADGAAHIQAACGAKVVVAPPSVVRIADDKRATAAFLERHGYSYPRTYTRAEWHAQALPFPLVAKPRVGCRSIGLEIVRDHAALARALARDDIVLQEYVGRDDSDFTCTVVFWRGQASEVVVLQRWLRAGDTYRVVPMRDATIERYVLDVATRLGIEGSCNFQLRVDGEGRPKLFEINARYSGTTPICAALGFNPVASYLLRDRGFAYSPTWRTDVVVLRHWAELIIDRAAMDTVEREHRGMPGVIARAML